MERYDESEVTDSDLASCREAAMRGAEWLDNNLGDWWEEGRIDLGRLDQSSLEFCVLGQLIDGWGNYREYGLSLEDTKILGFETTGNESYTALTIAWREVIEARR